MIFTNRRAAQKKSASTTPARPPAATPAPLQAMGKLRYANSPLRAGVSGLPANLRNGLENLSGVNLGDVQVHTNSSQPAQFNALAYAQGRQIHLAPGQEQHLPHEAWHLVQQRQGRVPVTTRVGGVGVNDSPALEREADRMGSLAARGANGAAQDANMVEQATPVQRQAAHAPMQRLVTTYNMSGVIMYQSTLIKNKLFNTYDDALKAERGLSESQMAKVIDLHARVPTVFTYMQTPDSGTIGGNVQGPHSIPEVALTERLMEIGSNADLDTEFGEQVPTSLDAAALLQAETTGPIADVVKKRHRYQRDYDYHLDAYKRATGLNPRSIKIKKYHYKSLLNMHPYAAYAYDMADPSSLPNWKDLIKGKGERKGIKTSKALDPNAKTYFTNKAEYAKFLKMRRKMLDARKSQA